MTPQEQQMIQSLAQRVNNIPLSEKDPNAERLLQQSVGGNPDALYILAQTVLVQGYALEQAQKQLAEARALLEQQRQQVQEPTPPKHATSFLGNLLGLGDESAHPAPPPPMQQGNQPAYTPVPQYGLPSYPAPGSSFGPPQYAQPQSGGFLRSAMQTATGVAAGALAFQGIESLIHGFGGGGSGGSSFFGGGSGGGRPEEIVNNYYGDAAPGGGHGRPLSSDIEDRRGSSFDDAVATGDHHDGGQGFLDDNTAAGNPDIGDDNSYVADDTSDSSDDSSFDDGSGSDDSSSGGDDSAF